jgi:putative flippase GtrA
MILLTEAAGINYLISATISFIVSVIFNYLASMRFVFTRKEDLSRHREFMIFIALSVVGLILNDLFMWMGTSILLIDYRITKIVATALVMIWNFVTRKIFLEAQ